MNSCTTPASVAFIQMTVPPTTKFPVSSVMAWACSVAAQQESVNRHAARARPVCPIRRRRAGRTPVTRPHARPCNALLQQAEVHVSLERIRAHEPQPYAIADIHAMIHAVHDSLGGRLQQACKRTLGRDAGNDAVEGPANTVGEQHGGDLLAHESFDVPGIILLRRAMLRES